MGRAMMDEEVLEAQRQEIGQLRAEVEVSGLAGGAEAATPIGGPGMGSFSFQDTIDRSGSGVDIVVPKAGQDAGAEDDDDFGALSEFSCDIGAGYLDSPMFRARMASGTPRRGVANTTPIAARLNRAADAQSNLERSVRSFQRLGVLSKFAAEADLAEQNSATLGTCLRIVEDARALASGETFSLKAAHARDSKGGGTLREKIARIHDQIRQAFQQLKAKVAKEVEAARVESSDHSKLIALLNEILMENIQLQEAFNDLAEFSAEVPLRKLEREREMK